MVQTGEIAKTGFLFQNLGTERRADYDSRR